MVRLWNWFKNHPGLTAFSALVALAGLVVASLALVRDSLDWTLPGVDSGQAGSGQYASPTPSSEVRNLSEAPTPPNSASGISASPEAQAVSEPGKREPGNVRNASPAERRAAPDVAGAVNSTPRPTVDTEPTEDRQEAASRSDEVKVSMSTTNYIFLSFHPIVVAPENPHKNVRADLQSGPGSIQSRSSTDFAPVQGGATCKQAAQWTRDPIALGRDSTIEYCLRLAALRPMKYLKMHVVVDSSDAATMTFFDA